MKNLVLNLTNDEFEWLEKIVSCGSEVTSYMSQPDNIMKRTVFPKGKPWQDIQYSLYEKVVLERSITDGN